MESRFDEVARVLAGGLSRREVFRRVLGIAAGAALASVGPAGTALAAAVAPGSGCCKPNQICPAGPNGAKVCCPDNSVCGRDVMSNALVCCSRGSVFIRG